MSALANLYDFDLEQLTFYLRQLEQPDYRARQVWSWMYQKYASDFEHMTDLPLTLRRRLAKGASLGRWQVAARQNSSDQMTTKVLFDLSDGNFIETVLMRYDKRRTICISTQAGCAMGCVFCATGQMGFARNLTVGEIVGQVLYFAAELASDVRQVTNIVFMGMGEPLHNYDNTVAALDRLTDPAGFGLSARKITISTVGLVPAIRRYADEKRQTPLAVSLHAATDEEREKLIPVARRWPLNSLMDACNYYVAQTGRRITFEWALIAGKNDMIDQAQKLGQLLAGMLCHVNLIPLNPTDGYGGRPSGPKSVAAFQQMLTKHGVTSTVRLRRGIDIQAGCGQLRDRFVTGNV